MLHRSLPVLFVLAVACEPATDAPNPRPDAVNVDDDGGVREPRPQRVDRDPGIFRTAPDATLVRFDASDAGGAPRDAEGAFADLTVRWLEPAPGFATVASAAVPARLQVGNAGAAAADWSRLRIALAGDALLDVEVPPLASGAGIEVAAPLLLPASLVRGAHELVAEIDVEDAVAESDEVNNRAGRRIVIWTDTVRLDPGAVDFGSVPIGCEARQRVRIENVSAAAISLTTIAATAPFALRGLPLARPLVLAPTDVLAFDVLFAPVGGGPAAGAVVITLEGQLDVALPLVGDGDPAARRTDTFAQYGGAEVDVLFVIDDSSDMAQEQQILATGFPALHAAALAEGVDYRIGVTTTDVSAEGAQGRLVGAVLTPATGLAAFAEQVQRGAAGSGNERGLAASVLALSMMSGLRRPGAALDVFYVSDEDDHSDRATDFVEALRAFAAPQVLAHAVVGTARPQCDGIGGRAEIGERYIAVAEQTGGSVISLCDPAIPFERIGRQLGLRHSFPLSWPAVAGTVSVEVARAAVPASDWRHDERAATVRFAPHAVPRRGAQIRITYAPRCR